MPYSFKNQKIQMVYSFFLNSIGPTPASGPTKYTKCEDYLFLPAYICRLVEYQWLLPYVDRNALLTQKFYQFRILIWKWLPRPYVFIINSATANTRTYADCGTLTLFVKQKVVMYENVILDTPKYVDSLETMDDVDSVLALTNMMVLLQLLNAWRKWGMS